MLQDMSLGPAQFCKVNFTLSGRDLFKELFFFVVWREKQQVSKIH